MIASTALSAGAALATRNVRDFAGLGVDVIDPWIQAG
jgi:predicted nucleic acid-binding protein